MKLPKIGMDGIKISIDLQMPMPPQAEREEHDDGEEFEECPACGEQHCPTEDCPDNIHNFRNNPIPALARGEPVVESEYINRVKAAEKSLEDKKSKKGKSK